MSSDPSSFSPREAPRRRSGGETVADFTLLVRIPGKPATFKAFTDAERGEAEAFAAANGGTLMPLPLDPPTGAPPVQPA
jgi:hypothetical protein